MKGTGLDVRTWIRDHPRIVSAAALAVGVPFLVVAGLAVTLLAMFLIQTWLLPPNAPVNPWIWTIALLVAGVPMWFLVSACLRAGGWQGIWTGLAMLAIVAVGFWFLGDLEAALDPTNGMAGVGSGILSVLLGGFAAVVLAMAGVAAWVQRRGPQPQ